jgi:hypothetical protein
MTSRREHGAEDLKAAHIIEIGYEHVKILRTPGFKYALFNHVFDHGAVFRFKLGRAVVGRHRAVRADTHMILTAHIDCVLDVPDDINRHRLSVFAQIGPEDDPSHATPVGHQTQCFIRSAARVI